MNSFFHKQFDEEHLVSEKLRTTILACIFLFGTLYTGVVALFFRNQLSDELYRKASIRMFIFLLMLFIFELLSFLYIKRQIKRRLKGIPLVRQYLNATMEITAPGIIMLLMAGEVETPVKILHSPVVYIYFIFIILSTLRLNYKISFFTGMLSCVEFLLLSIYMIKKTEHANTIETVNGEYFVTVAKSMVLFLNGIAAAFVARQIRLSINRSLKAAEEGNKIVNLFGQQVSKEIVDEMLSVGGQVKSKMMKVCVMFIDIRNFTNYVSDKSPAEIVNYQNSFFSIIVKAVAKHNGIINQFLGDGCMVTFGAPVILDNPSQYAVSAALEIRAQLIKEISKGNIPLTKIGIGIHTGDAVTGNIGTVERQQYSITGNVVILAARIEQLNKEFQSQILVSEEVKKTVNKPDTKFESLGAIDLKGWHQPLNIYKIA
jgi:adenylate cyclase